MQHVRNVQKEHIRQTQDQQVVLNVEPEHTQQQREQLLQQHVKMKAVMARLHSTANKGRAASDEDMNALAQHSYALNPNLQLLLSTITTKEQNICLLIRHNFQPTEIAALTISSPQTITNTRVRLLKKLFNEIGGAKDFDVRLTSF